MGVIKIKNGIVHIAESKANCPYCTKHQDIDVLEERLHKSKDGHFKIKCGGCKRLIGITCNIRGDFVSYKLLNSKWK